MILQWGEYMGSVSLDDTRLPGAFQSLSVNGEVIIDSGNSAGNNKPRKVMRGYADKVFSLNLILVDDADYTVYEQLEELEHLFRRLNGGVPKVFAIANEHLIARGITQVIFKSLSSSENAGSNRIEVSLGFEEFIKAGYDGSQ